VRVTESDTDLRRGETLTCELDNVLDDVVIGGFQPCRWCAAVREGRGRYMG
jgi:hypothetical protein